MKHGAASSFVFSSYSASYDFTTAVSKAFGNNQILSGGIPSIYQGDVYQDGLIDLTDIVLTQNQMTSYTSNPVTDLNCDGSTDLTDILVVYNNSRNFIEVRKP